MLLMEISKRTLWDSDKEIFINIESQSLQLEHSLFSVSKWESKYKKSFFKTENKTIDETLYYINCMNVLDTVIEPTVLYSLYQSELNEISKYIEEPMTATIISKKNKPSRDIITSEIIYYWMICLEIPFECDHWHLSRLLMLIDVCGIKNEESQGKSKMSKNDVLARNAKLNASRRAAGNSKG